MKIIEQNPYRILGISINASLKEQTTNARKMSAYLNVGKEVHFDSDLDELIPNIHRNQEVVDDAIQLLNLPKDKIKYAMFWIAKPSSTTGSIAYNHLISGNIDKSISIFEKTDLWESLLNRGVIALEQGNIVEGILLICSMLDNDEYRLGFLDAVVGDLYPDNKDEFISMFIDSLMQEIDIVEIYPEIRDCRDVPIGLKQQLNSLVLEGLMEQIRKSISVAKQVDAEDADAQYNAANKLIESTKNIRLQLIQLADHDDMHCQMLVDKLANQILQCGINYFNAKDSHDDIDIIESALKIQQYALDISIGPITKGRCQENVDILLKLKSEATPKSVECYDTHLKSLLLLFLISLQKDDSDENSMLLGKHRLKTIEHWKSQVNAVLEFIEKSIPYLQSISAEVGYTNEYYLNMSTKIESLALHKLVEIVNAAFEAHNNGTIKLYLEDIQGIVEPAWHTTILMDSFDLLEENKEHYQQNRASLKDIAKGVDISVTKRYHVDVRNEQQRYSDCKSIKDLKEFLVIFPDCKHHNKAKALLEKMQFDSCKTVISCRKFKEEYPNSEFPIDVKMDDIWYESCKTWMDYEKYIKQNPHGSHVSIAKKIVDDDKCWESIKSSSNWKDYKNYLDKFARGRHIDSVDKLWIESCAVLEDYEQYVKYNPKGKFVSNAQKIIVDERFWAQVCEDDSKSIYKEYLRKFPKGRHVDEATKNSKWYRGISRLFGG